MNTDTPLLSLATAVDLIADEATQQMCEQAYRRGLHHGIALAGDLADESLSLAQAQRLLTRAENVAGEYRSVARHPGRPPLMEEIRVRVLKLRRKAPTS
jgi:hypothetical protein